MERDGAITTGTVNSQHVSHLKRFQEIISLRPALLLKRVSGTSVFCEFCEISKNTFFYRTPPVAASVHFR